jgi:trehalose 6-phosphate phosphatase
VHLTDGKEIVELAVVTTHKGTAVTALRDESDADAVLFIGDDVTDENAFAVLRDQDVGIKVGPGETLARYRVPDPPAVVQVLELLLSARTSASI